MGEPVITGLTGRRVLIALITLGAVLAATAFALNAHRSQPLTTNAVGSASSDLAAGATAH